MLVGYGLDVSRAWMITHDDYCLTTEQEQVLLILVQRRLEGEPMAYILGEREFMGLSFQTSPAVLIPRPDTELLVETALALLAQSHTTAALSPKVLEMGTGSGAVACSIGHYYPSAQVVATDISPAALVQAQNNAKRLALSNIEFVLSDWYAGIESQQFDLIVSNPPYIRVDDEHLQWGDLRFEPSQALTDFADGLSAIRQIVAGAPKYLKSGAWLYMEHGWDQAEQVRDLLLQAGFDQVQSRRDLAGIERISGGLRV